MNKRLLKTSLSMPSVITTFRNPLKLSQQCKCFSPGKQLYGGSSRINCISRSYTTSSKSQIKSILVRARGGVVILLFGAGFFAFLDHFKQEHKKEKEAVQKEAVQKESVVKMASIGSRTYELVDTNGNKVTYETFYGKWQLIYFGSCQSDNICRDYLNKLTSVVKKVNEMRLLPNLQPVFITIDPKQDTKEQIKEYLKDFHKDFIGLTGSEAQVNQLCKAYRVQGPEGDDDIVDHTLIAYLVRRDGKFSEYYGPNMKDDEIVNSIMLQMM